MGLFVALVYRPKKCFVQSDLYATIQCSEVIMLLLKDICKTYKVGETSVEALKDINIEFRKSEFVSILGASGCGKTTLLNIIGGLDRYTSGDIVISGRSTKEYKDRDWDAYRNHSVGFVFQSYNLIPHQTVLENVELALTLSGVSKADRKKRAIEVLTKVGLSDKLKNKPNQLSGGQMQRVAIARALVNDPEIILADEPTGALDSTTSVQIMELLKEISKNKLIIMVTHNPELAEAYSSRIVRLKDGKLIDDSMPFNESEKKAEKKLLGVTDDKNLSARDLAKKNKKKNMSFFTALGLSLKNLLTKKGRTILVSFAGSIGIIGIALILAISSGFSTYINKMQEDTLSTYPITIKSKNVDFSSVIYSVFTGGNKDGTSRPNDGVYPNENISAIINGVGETTSSNNLKKFYGYIKENEEELKQYVNGIQYTYNLELSYATDSKLIDSTATMMQMIIQYSLLYLENQTGVVSTIQSDGSYLLHAKINEAGVDETDYTFFANYTDLQSIETALRLNGTCAVSSSDVIKLSFLIIGVKMDPSSMSSGMMTSKDVFYEMVDNMELLQSQYDLVGEGSRWPSNANEGVMVLDENGELDDYVMYSLGLLSTDQMDQILKGLINKTDNNVKIEYSDILNRSYKILSPSDYYVTDSDGNLVVDGEGNPINFSTLKSTSPMEYYGYLNQAIAKCTNSVKIVGIVRLNSTSKSGLLSSGVAYTRALTEHMMTYHNDSTAVTQNILSKLSLDVPDTILLYSKSFSAKDGINDYITKYNNGVSKEDKITYTDTVGLMMSTISTIITAITYVLIAFVSVSLIVSSIMIGIITYISVIERTREIGVLRSVGASKRDIRRVFTAESFIIGLSSGLFGIIISLILILPINIILQSFTGIFGLAQLPLVGSVILIVISVILTFIAGRIPSRIAAKKDPVVALRSE